MSDDSFLVVVLLSVFLVVTKASFTLVTLGAILLIGLLLTRWRK